MKTGVDTIRQGAPDRPPKGDFMPICCDTCAFNEYDEDDEAYYCSMDMDEDDIARIMQNHRQECPFYRPGDEYLVVRRQM